MPPIKADDVAGFSRLEADGAIRERMRELASIREKHDGTLAGIASGDPDIERVGELNNDLTVLAERLDEARELESGDEAFTRLTAYMTEVDPEHGHPGHSKVKPRGSQTRDLGGLFVESEAYKAFAEAGALDKVVTLPIAGLWPNYRGIGEVPGDGFALQAALFDSADYPIQPEFIAQPVETLYQPNNIGPLMAQGTTNSNAIRYPVETVTATGALEVAEGTTKPEADLAFAPIDEPVRKIAVLLPLTDESLDDVPFLRAYINARLRLFVQMREDSQLLNGNGTAPNIRGILNRSGINTATTYSIGGANPDQALIDGVFKAAMRVGDAFLEADAAVMKPSTWEIARLAKDTNRQYLVGPATEGATPRLWGLRIVLNANMPAQSTGNKVVLVGAFRAAAMLVRRSGIDLAVSDSHSTFFAENKVAIRAEERIALAVFRPAGFATVTSNA